METWRKNLRILWFTHFAGIMSFGFGLPFIPLYIQELGDFTRSEITLYATILSAAPAVTMGIMAPIWGYLADRFGRKLMILRASFFAAFVIAGMGMVTSVFQLFILRVAQGLLTGTISAVNAFVASDVPEENMASSLGTITSATFVGFSAGPMIGGILAAQFGYRLSFLLGGFLMMIVFLAVLFFVKEDKEKFRALRKEKREPIIHTYKKVLVPFVLFVLAMLFLLRISRTVFSPYLAIYIKDNVVDPGSAPLIAGLINGLTSMFTAISSIVVGRMSDKHDKFKLLKVLIFCALMFSIPVLLNALTGTVFGLFGGFIPFLTTYVMLYIFLGGVEPTVTSIATLSVSHQNRGALFGVLGMVGSLAWFFGPAVAGPIAYYYDIEAVIPIIPISLILMLIFSYLLGRANSKQN